MKALGSLKRFKPTFSRILTKFDILLNKDLLRTNIFYQCLVDYLLNLITHLFFQYLNLLLLIFCMDDQEYLTSFYCVQFYFHYRSHQN